MSSMRLGSLLLGSRSRVFTPSVLMRSLSISPVCSAKVSAKMVKSLREATGAPMMDCKKALDAIDGKEGDQLQLATDFLRKRGLAAAAKKSGRRTPEGLVALNLSTDGKTGYLAEVACETDFVAQNELFKNLMADIICACSKVDSTDTKDVLESKSQKMDGTVGDHFTDVVTSLRENIQFRRIAKLHAPENGVIMGYMHNSTTIPAEAPRSEGTTKLGRIGCLVSVKADNEVTDDVTDLASRICMHIAASTPLFLDKSTVDVDALDKEKTLLIEQARESGKKEDLIERMVTGRLNKYYEENCLLDQVFLVASEEESGGKKISVEKAAKKSKATVVGYEKFLCGEQLPGEVYDEEE